MSTTFLLYRILTYVSVPLLLGGAALLLHRSSGSVEPRARRTLAFILLMWGVAYLSSALLPHAEPVMQLQPLSAYTLIAGNLYIILCLLYPLELVRPGWLTVRNVLRLVAPYVCVVAGYLLGLLLLGERVRPLGNATEFILHISEFNVWYRAVLYLSICFYLTYLFIVTGIRAAELKHRHGGKLPLASRRQIQWLNLYGIGIVAITAAYLAVLFFGTTGSLIVHRLVAVSFFSLALCKALFSRNQAAPEPTAPDQ